MMARVLQVIIILAEPEQIINLRLPQRMITAIVGVQAGTITGILQGVPGMEM
jgi:hypothetical protein